METLSRGNILVCYSSSVFDREEGLRAFLDGPVLGAYEARGERMIVVLGGDGTMLRAIHEHHHLGLPFLGVDYGRKWYLLQNPKTLHADTTFESLSYPLLDNTLLIDDQTHHYISFNDSFVRTTTSSIHDFRVSLGDVSLDLRGDGFLVATPAGSTAYARSAGASVIPHIAPLFSFVPLHPFEPICQSSILYCDGCTLAIEGSRRSGSRISIFTDSRLVAGEIEGAFTLTIKKSTETVTLLVPSDCIPSWREKIYIEQGFSPRSSDH